MIAAHYHDGSNFENVTQASGNIIDADGVSHTLVFNNTLNLITGHLKVPISATLGKWQVTGSITDLYGNTATGQYSIQIVNATLKFAVNAPTSERTTVMNITARISYPDGTTVNSTLIAAGFNVTLRHGNFTWTSGMRYNETNARWIAGYPIPVNATVGDYSLGIALLDIYGNGGVFNSTTSVANAKFVITVPHPKSKANPGNLIDISITVLYPNGSFLTTRGGIVIASLSNSSGTFTFPMIYNAGEGTWHEYFTAPDLGLSFGKAIPFSFAATDQYGNSGAAANAYELDVGAGIGALILSTVIGAIVPIALLGWAIATVSKRRRQHKP